MKHSFLAFTLAAGVAGCGDIPKDAEGSLPQIRSTGAFRVGLIAGSSDTQGRGRALIKAVAARTGATPRVTSGAAEPLLVRLEEGELDLVVGTMSRKSPWAPRVHTLAALSPAAEEEPVQLVALTRNGENAWIDLLHREVERIRGKR